MQSLLNSRVALFLTISMLAMGCGPSAPSTPPKVTTGSVAPAWNGIDLVDGTSRNFPDLLQGNPAVLVFWATWCPYCKVFMPYAGKIQADYVDEGVQIVTFNAKERGRGDPKAYVQGLGFPLIAIENADTIASEYDVEFIPGLMVVDGQGNIVYRRGWTELPAGESIAEQWDREVREALDAIGSS